MEVGDSVRICMKMHRNVKFARRFEVAEDFSGVVVEVNEKLRTVTIKNERGVFVEIPLCAVDCVVYRSEKT